MRIRHSLLCFSFMQKVRFSDVVKEKLKVKIAESVSQDLKMVSLHSANIVSVSEAESRG